MTQPDNNFQHRILKCFIFFYFSTIGLFLPYLPLVFRDMGFSNWQIGILFSMGPLVTIAVQPLWGFISDRFKTVKKLIICQLAVITVLSLIVFRINTFELLLPALFIFNVFAFPIIPLTDSLTLASVNQTGGHYGGFRLWGSIGFALSALFFGFFFRSNGLELFPLCYFSLLLLCFIISFFMSDALYIGRKASLSDMKQLVSDRRVITFLLLTALLSSSNRANDSFMGIFISQIGGNSETIGYAWMIAALSEVPVLALGGIILSRFTELRLLAAAALVFSIRWALFWSLSDPSSIAWIQLTHGISFGLFFLCSVSYMTRLVPDRLRSSGQGLLAGFIGGLAGIAGSTLGGMVMSNFGPRYLYAACSVLALAAMVFYFLRDRAETRSKNSDITAQQ
ncbi:MAG: MFS transporter [Bacillota bacterium]